MKVYIVTAGDKYDGQSVMSVHARREDAIKAAFDGNLTHCGPWIKSGNMDEWVSGDDVMRVEEWEVEP